MITDNQFPFGFDVNFSFGQDSVFTNTKEESDGINPPPISGQFMLLDGTHFLLLDGSDFNLL